jgi:hypothetical protein
VPASYMVSRVRKGPQMLEGFTLGEEGDQESSRKCPLPPAHCWPWTRQHPH